MPKYYFSFVRGRRIWAWPVRRAGADGTAATTDTPKGKALVDGKGMTLYVFDRDTTGASNCNGVCATNWPPFKAQADAKGLRPGPSSRAATAASNGPTKASRSTRSARTPSPAT